MTRVRVALYLTRGSGDGQEVLVFTQPDAPEAGSQIPAGGLNEGEDLTTAVIRECAEETGVECISDLRALAIDQTPHSVTGEGRVTVFFHAKVGDDRLPGRWLHIVGGRDFDRGMRYECSFEPITQIGPKLADGQGNHLSLVDSERPAGTHS